MLGTESKTKLITLQILLFYWMGSKWNLTSVTMAAVLNIGSEDKSISDMSELKNGIGPLTENNETNPET